MVGCQLSVVSENSAGIRIKGQRTTDYRLRTKKKMIAALEGSEAQGSKLKAQREKIGPWGMVEWWNSGKQRPSASLEVKCKRGAGSKCMGFGFWA